MLSFYTRRINIATILYSVSPMDRLYVRRSRTISGSSASERACVRCVVEKGAVMADRVANVGFDSLKACLATCRDSMVGYQDNRI